MGNDNGLVNYCTSRLRAHIRQGVLHDEKSEGEVRWRFKGTQKLRWQFPNCVYSTIL